MSPGCYYGRQAVALVPLSVANESRYLCERCWEEAIDRLGAPSSAATPFRGSRYCQGVGDLETLDARVSGEESA